MAGRGKVESVEVLDAGPLRLVSPVPKRLRVNLGSLDAIAAEIERVYRKVARGELDGSDGSKQAYILGQAAKVRTDAIQMEELPKLLELARKKIGSGSGNIQDES